MSAPEHRTLRLVPGGADGTELPRSVRRRAATRRRIPHRRDPITAVLEQLDQEPVLGPAGPPAVAEPGTEAAAEPAAEPAGAPGAEPEPQDAPGATGDAGPPRERPRRPASRRHPARTARRREPQRRRPGFARPRPGTVLLAVVLCAAIAAAGVLGSRWYGDRMLERAHQLALAAAKQTTVDFVSVSAGTVDRDLQRIVGGATGDFRDEFTRGQAQVRAAVVENNVESRGTVLRAALVSGDLDSAVVLVAVDATVRNSKAPDGRASHYRIQVDMAHDKGSGRWLVAKLQFVG